MRTIFIYLALLTSFLGFSQTNQNLIEFEQPHENHITCGWSKDVHTKLTSPSLKSLIDYPVYSQFTCGKFKVYYADFLPGAPAVGFADPILGQARRNTFCAVLTYVQSVFNFNNVSDSAPIRIEVEASFAPIANPAPTNVGYFAYAGPTINYTTDYKIEGGCVFDQITTGNSNALADGFHARMKVNFDQAYQSNGFSPGVIDWLNDYTQNIANCQIDLYSILLHEVGHMLGFLSLANNNGSLDPNSLSDHFNFSRLDFLLHKSNNLTANGLQKFILGSLTNANLNSVFINTPINDNKFWSSGNIAPNNIPIYSGSYDAFPGPAISYLSHIDDQRFTYDYRARNAPGFEDDYVMGPFGYAGLLRRNFTDTEIKIFLEMGYNMNLNYVNPNLNNLPPYSKKMGNAVGYETNMNFVETVTPNAQISNDVGNTYVYKLWEDIGPNGVMDPEGQPLTIANGSLTNIRGCGNGGNNHDQLDMINNNEIIFTPRAGFVGRAQFAFKLYDGAKEGSWHFVTVDVTTGNNVNYPIGSNLLINGNFEEGTEVRRINTTDITKPFTSQDKSYRKGFLHGQHLSDANPYNLSGNGWVPGGGDYIRDAVQYCNPYTFGAMTNSFPSDPYFFQGTSQPSPLNNQGDRYRRIAGNSNWFGLGASLVQCHRYILKLDYRNVNLPYQASNNLIFGFCNSITSSTVNIINETINPTTNSWTHVEIPFTYCSTNPTQFLNISNNIGLIIDNVVLVEVLNPEPFSVNISGVSPICLNENNILVANVVNPKCNVTYLWSNGATTSSVTVSPTSTQTYTVTVNDGCETISASKTVTVIQASGSCCTPPSLPPFNSPFNASALPNNSIIEVNANMTINQNLTFTGCTFRMGPNVKIIVNPGMTLNITNCSLFSCSEMWDGIEILAGGVLNLNGTRIEDAKEGVKSLSNASLTVNNCNFNKNKTAIRLEGWNNFNGVNGTTFDCSTTNSPTPYGYLKAPFEGEKSFYGIYMSGMNTATIGGTTENLFTNLEIGIYVRKSLNVSILKNKFTNINTLCPIANVCTNATVKGWGIFTDDIQNLSIGHSTNSLLGNIFSNSYNGILVNNCPKFAIHRNTFNDILNAIPSAFGIYFCIYIGNYGYENGFIGYDNFIQNNTFSNFNRGIYYTNNYSNSLTISQNKMSTFNETSSSGINIFNNTRPQTILIEKNIFNENTNQFGRDAINIENAVATNGTNITVKRNTIRNVRNGIRLSLYNNVKIIENSSNYTSIGTTKAGIYFPTTAPTATTITTGIKLQGCNGTSVRSNSIQRTNYSTSSPLNGFSELTITQALYMFGIYVGENCINSSIIDNTTLKMGTGIYVIGTNNNPVTLKCNHMKFHPVGLHLNGVVGTQGSSTSPQDNQWAISAGAYGVKRDGSLPSTFYTRSLSMPFMPNQSNQFFPTNAITVFTTTGSPTYTCQEGCANPPCLLPAGMMQVITSTGEYSLLSEEELKTLDIELYKSLKITPYTYDEYSEEGEKYQEFMDSMDMTNAYKIYELEKELALKDTVSVKQKLEAFEAYGDVELNYKKVFEVYINTWMKGKYELEAQDSTYLKEIANQSPRVAGNAVYMARVMLSIDTIDTETYSAKSMIQSNSLLFEQLKLYPNPGSEFIHYELPILENEKGIVRILDVSGKIIKEWMVDNQKIIGSIDVSHYSKGIYLIELNLNNGKSIIKKLVVE